MNRALVLSATVTFAFFAFYGLPVAVDGALSQHGVGDALPSDTDKEARSGDDRRQTQADAEDGGSRSPLHSLRRIRTSLQFDPAQAEGSPTYQGKTARWWAKRAVQARRDANKRGQTIRRLRHAQLRTSAHLFDWMAAANCVMSKEGRWDTNTGNGYYGAFQADLGFQRTYAPDHMRRWGTADRWPWYAQLEMAYRGWLFRGWQPWPNTSRACGLR